MVSEIIRPLQGDDGDESETGRNLDVPEASPNISLSPSRQPDGDSFFDKAWSSAKSDFSSGAAFQHRLLGSLNAMGAGSAPTVSIRLPSLLSKFFGGSKGILDGANFAQKTFGKNFSQTGKFAGQTVDDVASQVSSGALKIADVPIDYIVRNGNTLILNTRSSQALIRAGVPRSQWNGVNRSGQGQFEAMLTGQLKRNKLTDAGISTARQSGTR